MLTTLDQQIEKIGTMLTENPEDIGVLIAYAEFHYRRGRYLEALQAYQRVVTLRQDISDVHLGLAKIYMRQNMIADAYNELLQVFTIVPHDIEAHVMYRRLMDIKEPQPEIEEAFQRFSECEPDLLDIGFYRQQKELEVEKMEQEILELEKIMEEHDEEPICEYNYEMAVMRKKNIESLFSYIQKLEAHLMEKASQRADALEAETAAIRAEDREAPGQPEVPEFPGEPGEPEISPLLITPGDEGKDDMEPGVDLLGDIEDIDEKSKELTLDEEMIELPGLPDDIPGPFVEEEETTPGALDVVSGIEEEPEAAEGGTAEAVSEERIRFYGEIRESVTSVMAGLIKTKGVTVVMTVARDGYIIDSIVNEAISYDEIGGIVGAGVDSIARWRSNEQGKAFLYWVLEFEQGLLVMRAVNNEHYLLAIAKAGANFGAMRFSMEKGKEALDEILSMSPPL